jgi:hypothetical protein
VWCERDTCNRLLRPQTKRGPHPNRSNRDVPHPRPREQPSGCGVRGDAVSLTVIKSSQPSLSLWEGDSPSRRTCCDSHGSAIRIIGIARRAAALSGQDIPACAPPHLLLGSALDPFVVQSLSDPRVVFLKLTAGLEVVPSPLFARGSVARSPEPLRSWRTVRGRVRQGLLS